MNYKGMIWCEYICFLIFLICIRKIQFSVLTIFPFIGSGVYYILGMDDTILSN